MYLLHCGVLRWNSCMVSIKLFLLINNGMLNITGSQNHIFAMKAQWCDYVSRRLHVGVHGGVLQLSRFEERCLVDELTTVELPESKFWLYYISWGAVNSEAFLLDYIQTKRERFDTCRLFAVVFNSEARWRNSGQVVYNKNVMGILRKQKLLSCYEELLFCRIESRLANKHVLTCHPVNSKRFGKVEADTVQRLICLATLGEL